jgi:hypothetical protein
LLHRLDQSPICSRPSRSARLNGFVWNSTMMLHSFTN